MADLDLLRNINNTYGHLAGDIVLAGIGDIIRQGVREYDIAGRFGGEEFVVVLDHASETGVHIAFERLRAAIEENVFPQVGRVTVSVGGHVESFEPSPPGISKDDVSFGVYVPSSIKGMQPITVVASPAQAGNCNGQTGSAIVDIKTVGEPYGPIPITLAASIPPITVVPMIWRATDPAPVAVHSGTQPRMNAKDVIKIGRRRSLAPSSAASAKGFPCSYCSLANSTMRIAFLAAKPMSMTSPICE